jgi:hypothetical protein
VLAARAADISVTIAWQRRTASPVGPLVMPHRRAESGQHRDGPAGAALPIARLPQRPP